MLMTDRKELSYIGGLRLDKSYLYGYNSLRDPGNKCWAVAMRQLIRLLPDDHPVYTMPYGDEKLGDFMEAITGAARLDQSDDAQAIEQYQIINNLTVGPHLPPRKSGYFNRARDLIEKLVGAVEGPLWHSDHAAYGPSIAFSRKLSLMTDAVNGWEHALTLYDTFNALTLEKTAAAARDDKEKKESLEKPRF